MKPKHIFILFIVFLSVFSCRQNEVFFQYKNVASKGWGKDSLLNFDIRITDTVNPYNVYVHVRHHGDYPYQNIWLFTQQINPDSTLKRDTIEAYLADQYGKWLGTGVGALKEMPIFYRQQIHFPDTGIYRLKIGHGMRDSLLRGIKDIGVRIELVQ